MSGIAGIIYPNAYQPQSLIKAMLAPLANRNASLPPQTYRYKNLEMGTWSNSLSANPHQTVWVMLDGDIFNAREIRKELKTQGYHSQSLEDAELLAMAYEAWGTAFLTKIEGAFAIVIFDLSKQKIILARDPLGQKPLYWAVQRDYFFFGSELKSLLASGHLPQAPAPQCLGSYLFFGYIPQDMTPIKNVNKLLPAYYLESNLQGNYSVRPYWSYSSYFMKSSADDEIQICETLENLLSNSIQRRLSPNLTTGCLVGGGQGSAALAYYLSILKDPKEDLCAFTANFQGEHYGDSTAADTVTDHLKLSHQQATVTPQDISKNLVAMTWYLDEPLADPHVLATWKISNLAAQQNMDTLFASTGADELLAGNNRYCNDTITKWHIHKLRSLSQGLIHDIMFPLTKLFSTNTAYRMLRRFHTDPGMIKYLIKNSVFSPKQLAKISPELSKYFSPETFLQKFFQLHQMKSDLASFLYFETKTALSDRFLTQYDRLTQAKGLKYRAPFLDRRIVEYLAMLPDEQLINNGITAFPLKSLLTGVYPQALIERPKVGRQHFLNSWLQTPDLKEIIKLLENSILVESGFISKKWLKKLINSPTKQSYNFTQLWSILSLETWFRIFIDAPLTSSPPDTTLQDFFRSRN
ncbi:MAG: asparagine synthetase B family protein [Chlamydiota bacterium]